ncbi:hypothetical protein Pcinc_025108 [Petrolisthes cinctipes]|uniref:CCHC-type domain-containing protein n=1 Tax=Petrolisthes cinctipes TaxID=88211 RepID=A0AAE1F9Y1_PETCI|nr:hypothetical protein Pcinc_025108 [Petrolisthes cinctipes]
MIKAMFKLKQTHSKRLTTPLPHNLLSHAIVILIIQTEKVGKRLATNVTDPHGRVNKGLVRNRKKQMFWQDKQRGPIHQVSQGRSGLDLNNPTNNQSGDHLHAQARPQSQVTPPPHRQAPSRPPHHLQPRHRTPTIHQTSNSPTRYSEYYNNNYNNNNNNNSNSSSCNGNNYYTHLHGVRSPTTTIQPRIPSYPHLANNTRTSDTGRSFIHQVIRGDNYDQDYPPLPPPTQLPTTRGRCYNCGDTNHIRKNCLWDHKVSVQKQLDSSLEDTNIVSETRIFV